MASLDLHHRPFQSESDYGHMRQLLIENLARTGPVAYATIGDLDWWRAAAEDPRLVNRVQLWFDERERLVAFAWPEDDQVDIVTDPDYPTLHYAALAWAESQFRLSETGGASQSFRAWAYTRDTARIAALEARGYQRTEGGLVLYGRSIPARPKAPSLPPGFTIRHVGGEEDSEARAAVQREAFESNFMTAERHARVRNSPTYRPELDIVVVGPDGRFAAFALVWLDTANRLGVFEPLGVAVAYQRRGLGRALMMEGLRRLRAFGAEYARVGTGIVSSEPRALYEATGFVVMDYNYAWRFIPASSTPSMTGGR